jgi:hypothetical protein
MRRASLGGGIGGMKKEEQIRKAAEAYMVCGEVEKYCELMVELGEWERALAVAPGVSYAFWQDLSAQYGRKLAEDMSEDCVPFFASSGHAAEGVDFFAKRNQFKQAFSLASACNAGSFRGDSGSPIGEGRSLEEGKEGSEPGAAAQGQGGSKFILRATARQMSDHYTAMGEHVLAAASFLATNDVDSAFGNLLEGKQFLLAYGLAKCAGFHDDGRLTELEATFVGEGEARGVNDSFNGSEGESENEKTQD